MTSEVPKIKLVFPFHLEAMGVPSDSLVKITQPANDKIKNSSEVAIHLKPGPTFLVTPVFSG